MTFVLPLADNPNRMDGIEQRKKELIETIERELPDFGHAVKNETNDMVVLHQDAFAADYQDEEYVLLGKAIKYAGVYKKELRVIGGNRESLKK
jgi:hypothetical protein